MEKQQTQIRDFELNQLKDLLHIQSDIIKSDMSMNFDDISDREREVMNKLYTMLAESEDLQNYVKLIGFSVPISIFDRRFHKMRLAIYNLKLSYLESQLEKKTDKKEIFLIKSLMKNMKDMIEENKKLISDYKNYKKDSNKLIQEIDYTLKESLKSDKLNVLILCDTGETEREVLKKITENFDNKKYKKFILPNALFTYKIVKNDEMLEKKIDTERRYDMIIVNENMDLEINKLLYCIMSGKSVLLTY